MAEPKRPVQVPIAQIGSIRYMRRHGLRPPCLDFGKVIAGPARGREIAAAYMAAPTYDPAALAAYRAFRDETRRQFDFLTNPVKRRGLGVHVATVRQDPYADATEMTRDLLERGGLEVFATGGEGNEHPLLSDDDNDMFRAVHDVFGHASIGRGFDRHGEEAAWLKHSHMYTPLARLALTTETRGQNNALIYSYGGRRFPEQKLILLPEKYSDWPRLRRRVSRPGPRTICAASDRNGAICDIAG